MNGILIVNKPYGLTSRDVVNELSKIFNIKKIGHTGTLDPIATGVLVICIGKATKLVEILTSNEKEYIAEVTLGINTSTLDNTGDIKEEVNVNIPREKIIKALNKMKGEYLQEVPIYSAVKVNGRKLYEYARKDEEVNLPKRLVNIKKLELISDPKYIDGKTIFSIKCVVSKGTYIRSLIRDIASTLDTVGIMSKLNRVRQGSFLIEDSYTIDEIKKNKYEIIPIEKCLDSYKEIVVDEILEQKIKNGMILDNIYDESVVVFKNRNKEIISIYKTYEKDDSKMKPWKMF